MACHLGLTTSRLAIAASAAAGEPKRRRPPPATPRPSVAEVRRAIGVPADPFPSEKSSSSSAFMEFLATTPIGQPESAPERRLREAAEWVVEKTEAPARNGQRILMMLCMKILPLWLFLLFVAFGVVKLPFDIPYLDSLLM